MKRINLFEFEDLRWFPNFLRNDMTKLILVMHKLLKTADDMSVLVSRMLKETKSNQILDLCSGGGGPMTDVFDKLKNKDFPELKMSLSDLYPNMQLAKSLERKKDLEYITKPVDATNVNSDIEGLRTMVSSFHHMDRAKARKILEDAQERRQPICILEISDNSFPKFLWWTAIPFNLIFSFFTTLFVKPLSWHQLLFTYLIPVLPITYAWDGAVSNARTYSMEDLDILLEGLGNENYKWEKGLLTARGKKLYLLGIPQ